MLDRRGEGKTDGGRMTLLRGAWVPFLLPCPERRGKALGPGGGVFRRTRGLALRGAGFWVRGFGPVREVNRGHIRVLKVMKEFGFYPECFEGWLKSF